MPRQLYKGANPICPFKNNCPKGKQLEVNVYKIGSCKQKNGFEHILNVSLVFFIVYFRDRKTHAHTRRFEHRNYWDFGAKKNNQHFPKCWNMSQSLQNTYVSYHLRANQLKVINHQEKEN